MPSTDHRLRNVADAFEEYFGRALSVDGLGIVWFALGLAIVVGLATWRFPKDAPARRRLWVLLALPLFWLPLPVLGGWFYLIGGGPLLAAPGAIFILLSICVISLILWARGGRWTAAALAVPNFYLCGVFAVLAWNDLHYWL